MKNLPSDKLFDIGIQFKMNSSIFKSSFEIITNFIIQSVWSKVQQEFLEKAENTNQDFAKN